jgi:hypothetical protein
MRFLFLFGFLIAWPNLATAVWTPPPNPDPMEILHDARVDSKAGRHEDALAKFLWFHKYALELDRSVYGVRLSNALRSWHELGMVYPPALASLRGVRDETAKQVLKGQENVREEFHDFQSINEELGEDDRTVAVFVTFDMISPEKATQVYDLAEPALVHAKEFALCGKYLQQDKSLKEMLEVYRLDLKFAAEQKTPFRQREEKDFAIRSLENRAATVIALLVLNDRRADAEQFANNVKLGCIELKNSESLANALKGRVPK